MANRLQLFCILQRKQQFHLAAQTFVSCPIIMHVCCGHDDSNACTGVGMGPTWGPAVVGAVIGAAYAALNRFGMRRIWRAPHAPLNVVVTGGTRGLGKAMAREFLRSESTPAACKTAIVSMKQ